MPAAEFGRPVDPNQELRPSREVSALQSSLINRLAACSHRDQGLIERIRLPLDDGDISLLLECLQNISFVLLTRALYELVFLDRSS